MQQKLYPQPPVLDGDDFQSDMKEFMQLILQAQRQQSDAVNSAVPRQNEVIEAVVEKVDKLANMRSRSESPERRTARSDVPVASEGAGAPTNGLPAQWDRSNPVHY